MAVENAPWGVDGAEHSAAVVRTLAFANAGGNEGVATPTALEVRATPAPSGQVAVMPGAVTILNGAADEQAYTARVISQELVDVEPTGSAGGRTDYVWAEIRDPEFPGQPVPPDATAALHWQYFHITVAPSAPSGNAAYRLARIDIPSNTTVVTQEMITDLRELANPKSVSVIRSRPHVIADSETLSVGAVDGEYFPNAGGEQWIEIPGWATHAVIIPMWTSVRIAEGSNWGEYWVEYGPYLRPSTRQYSTQRFLWDGSESGGVTREVWAMSDQVAIPESIRGTTQAFVMKARYHQPGGAWIVSMDGSSGVTLEVRFLQLPEVSST